MPTTTNNSLGNYTVGQAPGQNQVNLGAMYGNLGSVLGAGGLGAPALANNPMSSVIQNGGQSALDYQNAMANARMADLATKSQENDLMSQEQAWAQQQKQPGFLNYLNTILSGAGAVEGAYNKYKGSPNNDMTIDPVTGSPMPKTTSNS